MITSLEVWHLAVVGTLPRRDRDEHLNLYVATETRQRIRRVAMVRQTNETAAIRFLLSKALEWFEGLGSDDKDAS